MSKKKRYSEDVIEPTKKPTAEEISTELTKLRELVETSDDRFVSRMAQAMETVILWATQETFGWKVPSEEAVVMAEILRGEVE
jgi:hypothetical protein